MKIVVIYVVILFMYIFAVKESQQNVTASNVITTGIMSTTPSTADLTVQCPAGFDSFQNHCFHISKRRGFKKSATSLCKRMGGYQTWIDGNEKESIASGYLRAHFNMLYQKTPFVWLPTINTNGINTNGVIYTFADSKKNATLYLRKHVHQISKYMNQTHKLDFYINVFGYAFHCSRVCWRLQAFCEAKPKNSGKSLTAQQPVQNEREDCPRGFHFFMNHCFYISRRSGNEEFARKVCYRIGGYQPRIDGRQKEEVILSYLRANMNIITSSSKSVWLPRIVTKGKSVEWIDSGKSANSFVKRYRLNPNHFKETAKRHYLTYSLTGWVKECRRGCWTSQALCETESLTDSLTKNDWKKRKNHWKKGIIIRGKRIANMGEEKKKPIKPTLDIKSTLAPSIQSQQSTLAPSIQSQQSTLAPSIQSQPEVEQCPDKFDEYKQHCFYIGRRKLSIRYAKEKCKELGGYQVDIADERKEDIVLSYLKANKERVLQPSPYLWLSTVVGDGRHLTWLDTANSAKYFLRKRKYIGKTFYTQTYFERELFMHFSGQNLKKARSLGVCVGECRRHLFQPFCETEMEASNKGAKSGH